MSAHQILPQQSDLSVGQDDVPALDGGQLQSQVRHLCLHLPLLLPVLDLLALDVEKDLFIAQLIEEVTELRLDLTAIKYQGQRPD